MALRWRFGSALLVLCASCGGGDSTPAPADAGSDALVIPPPLPWKRNVTPLPQDDLLRVNHVQVLGTHNSYHVEKEGNTIADWHYTMPPLDEQLQKHGVRQIELDLHYKTKNDPIEVHHIGALDEKTTCATFRECLRVIGTWSGAHPNHFPIYVQMEPKGGYPSDDAEGYFAAVEGEILSVLVKERIITPDEVQGNAATLGEAVAKNGWPTLAQTRGRIIFMWDDGGEVRAAYSRGRTSLKGRLMFVESMPGDPLAAASVLNDPVADAAKIKAALAANMIVRTMDGEPSDDDVKSNATFDAALSVGVTWISTNFPAPVSYRTYHPVIPGGNPARCNPITAPPSCVAKDLEDLGP